MGSLRDSKRVSPRGAVHGWLEVRKCAAIGIAIAREL